MPELPVIDAARLRLVQAATEGPWRPGKSLVSWHHVIKVEPNGTAVGSNTKAIVVAEETTAPFEGEAIHIIPKATIPKSAKTALIDGDKLTTDKGDVIELLVLSETSVPMLVPYPNYKPVLAKLDGGEYPLADYGFDGKALTALLMAHPKWPGESYYRLRHLSDKSVSIDMGLPGVTALLALATNVRRG